MFSLQLGLRLAVQKQGRRRRGQQQQPMEISLSPTGKNSITLFG